jgi:hypothetical protein
MYVCKTFNAAYCQLEYVELTYVYFIRPYFKVSKKRRQNVKMINREWVQRMWYFTKEFIHLRPKERFICPLLYRTVAKSMDLGWGYRVNPRPESTISPS